MAGAVSAVRHGHPILVPVIGETGWVAVVQSNAYSQPLRIVHVVVRPIISDLPGGPSIV
jgi:hypothetical protein